MKRKVCLVVASLVPLLALVAWPLRASEQGTPTGSTGRPAPPPVKAGLQSVKDAVQGFGQRGGLTSTPDPFGENATRLVYLDQGWGPAETLWYYHADQGSMLLPRDVLVHLEQPDSQSRIVDPANLSRFRFLNQHKTPNNPDALPVGFARHDDHIGLTCAACHTGQIIYNGTAVRIDGAPALIDMIGFFQQIEKALDQTLSDDAKLTRFATASGRDQAAARTLLGGSQRWFKSYSRANASTTREGYGRLDAVGRILNAVIRMTSDEGHSLPPNAPNSFPLLWDAPRHDYVQWGGFAGNSGAGALGRNAGEVIGVFGRVDVKNYKTAAEAKRGYRSSIEGLALVAMEESLRKLKSPRWPSEILPPPNATLVARGEPLYKQHCQACHALINRDDPGRKVVAYIAGIDVVGTDPQSVQNLVAARAPTGILKGAISPKGEVYGAEASVLTLLADLVTRSLSAQPAAGVAALAGSKLHGIGVTEKQGNFTRKTPQNPTADLLSYKARPLNGIWASAPYLHNGSVPTLYDLLRPATARPKQFSVGRWTYDPKRVGYVSDGPLPWVHDTTLTGNHNSGHEYGTALPEDDRLALLEYLKTL
jgi:hypothetical protein